MIPKALTYKGAVIGMERMIARNKDIGIFEASSMLALVYQVPKEATFEDLKNIIKQRKRISSERRERGRQEIRRRRP